jgi:hypothetical protein
MQWKSEYAGLIPFILFGLSLPIAAIEFFRRREASLLFRRGLVVRLFSSFAILMCAIGWLVTSSNLLFWLGVAFFGVSIIAGRFLRHVAKKEGKESAGARV